MVCFFASRITFHSSSRLHKHVITTPFPFASEQFQLLAGVSASPSVIRFLTYKALTFDETVLQIDTCRAYFSGPKLIVEIDIVMEPSTPLWKAHDVGEALQMALEKLEDVERAYVHVDFETGHKPVSAFF